MQLPVQVTFRDVPKSEAVDHLVHELAHKLERVCDHIDSCRVAIERPHKNTNNGGELRVRVDLTVPPGHEVVVTREGGDGQQHEDVQAVLREAFHVAQRRLQKLNEQQRDHVKRHPKQEIHAVITKLNHEYGFITTPEGREIYFHKNSVVTPTFEQLQVGNGVAFSEELGEDGPQATSIRVIDRRGHDEDQPS